MELVLRFGFIADCTAHHRFAIDDALARRVDEGRRAPSRRISTSGSHASTAHGDDRWFAVQTRPHLEWRAAAHLNNQGFLTFLPLCQKTRRHARKIETVNAPLFPCYLFVRLDLTRDRWRSVNGTVGVVTLVMSAGAPQPIPVGVVERFEAATSESGLVKFDADLHAGQAVRMTSGPFADLLGVLEKLDGADRARVLLEIMGGRVPVSVSRHDLNPAAT